MTQKTTYTGPKLALYQPDIPQNTAAIIRTCSCLGVELEIIEPCGFLTDPRFKRVVMDYMDISSIKFYKSYEEFEKTKINQRIILATTKAKQTYINFEFKEDDTHYYLAGKVLEFLKNCIKSIKYKIKIPMIENKRSLNISTSAAIIISESLRQTKFNLI